MRKTRTHAARLISILLVLGALAFTMIVSVGGNFVRANPPLSSSAAPLAQFTSQGHVVGFQDEGVLVSNATYALRVEFIGANSVSPLAESSAHGLDDAAPPLERVTYSNLWNGITLTYDAPENGILRSTYTLAPYARVEAIRLLYNAPLTVNADGTLSAMYRTGQISESAPVAWQERKGERVPVDVAFVAQGEKQMGFTLGEYDPQIPLVIDPVLTWNTFLGSGADEFGRGMAIDGSGNVYVAGISGATWGTPVRAFSGFNENAFVAKLDSNGTLVWNTFLGGNGFNHGTGIAVDGSGNVYVSGISTSTWGTPVRSFTGTNDDAFAVKLNASGALTWNTFLGGDGVDHGQGIAVDGSGNVYVAGISGATWGTPVRAFSGFNDDGFAAKLASNGALTWNTFLGGDNPDHGIGIAVDGSGNAYMVGISTTTWGTPVRAFTGSNDDAFAAKLASNGGLTWNTFLGGEGVDHGAGIAVDGSGNVYVTGISGETWGTPVRAFTGFNDDAFAAKLNSSGGLTWNTFLGANTPDQGAGIAVDGTGNVYVTGLSDDTWGTPVRAFSGDLTDAFAAKLNSNGALQGNTFLGGILDDNGEGIAVDGSGNVYVMGTSRSTWGTPIRAFSGFSADAFVAQVPDITSCAQKPEPAVPIKPRTQTRVKGPKVKLDWTDSACATSYKVIVREGSKTGPRVFKQGDLHESKTTTGELTIGEAYFWRVLAINSFGKTKSAWGSFMVK